MNDDKKPPRKGIGRGKCSRTRKLDDPQRRKLVLDVLEFGASLGDASVAAGIDHSNLNSYRRDNPKFAEQVDVAQLAGKIICLKTVKSIAESAGTDKTNAHQHDTFLPLAASLGREHLEPLHLDGVILLAGNAEFFAGRTY